MARDNYSYKKYQRELAKKKKREDKLLKKLNKKLGKDGEGQDIPEGEQDSGAIDANQQVPADAATEEAGSPEEL